MSGNLTEPTWPENRQPTPNEFCDWFSAQTRAGQLDVAERVLRWADEAQTCFEQNHEGIEQELTWTRQLAVRYRLAWFSARRRIHPLNFLAGYKAAREVGA